MIGRSKWTSHMTDKQFERYKKHVVKLPPLIQIILKGFHEMYHLPSCLSKY